MIIRKLGHNFRRRSSQYVLMKYAYFPFLYNLRRTRCPKTLISKKLQWFTKRLVPENLPEASSRVYPGSVYIQVCSTNCSAALLHSDCMSWFICAFSICSNNPVIASLKESMDSGYAARVFGSTACLVGLPYGVGEAASAWGGGSRMVAGNTQTQQYCKTRRRGILVSLLKCKKTTNPICVHSEGQRQMNERRRMEKVKNDLQTKLQRWFIYSLYGYKD